MSRLIDADALIKVIMSSTSYSSYEWAMYADDIIETYIDLAPTIDAVEVVRCKHCRRWLNGDDTYGTCQWNQYQTLQTRYDDFCSYGERK